LIDKGYSCEWSDFSAMLTTIAVAARPLKACSSTERQSRFDSTFDKLFRTIEPLMSCQWFATTAPDR
jgi:hypothetical protein